MLHGVPVELPRHRGASTGARVHYEYTGTIHAHAVAAWHALTAAPVQPLGMERLYHAARLAAGGRGVGAAGGGAGAGDAQDPANILGQIGEFLEVCRL